MSDEAEITAAFEAFLADDGASAARHLENVPLGWMCLKLAFAQGFVAGLHCAEKAMGVES